MDVLDFTTIEKIAASAADDNWRYFADGFCVFGSRFALLVWLHAPDGLSTGCLADLNLFLYKLCCYEKVR